MEAVPLFDQDQHWLLTPSIVMPPGFVGSDEDINIAHRPFCDFVRDLEYFDPEIHPEGSEYKVGFSYIDLANDTKLHYYSGSAFEILCQMFSHSSYTWLRFDFCDNCVEIDHESHPLEQFLAMLPLESMKDVLGFAEEEIYGYGTEGLSRTALGLVMREAQNRLGNGDWDGLGEGSGDG